MTGMPDTPDKGEALRSRTGLRRLGVGLLIGAVAWTMPFAAASSVLLPAKIAILDPHDKVGLLAILTIAGSIVALLSNVLFGALSDLTRSRFGSRNPWIFCGGIVAAAFMLLLSTANDIATLILWWCLFSAAMNAVVASVVAVIPDRVPRAKRGSISAIYGAGTLVGVTAGAIVAAQFIATPSTGMVVLAIVIGVLPIVFVFVAPDFSNAGTDRGRFSGRDLLKSFALPRKAPDFYWALLGRLAIVLGYFMISAYQLYILTDYIHLDSASAAAIISFGALITLTASIVGTVVSGPISDRIGRRKLPVIAATVLFSVAILLPFAFPTAWAMLVFAGVAGFGFGIYISVDAALMTEVLPNENTRGKDLGILNMANTGGQILAPAASSLVVGIGIGFGPVFLIAVAFCLLGALAIVPIRSVR